MRSCAAIAIVVVVASSVVRAGSERDYEFSVGIGYSHLSLDGSAAPFDHRDGVRVEPRFSFSLNPRQPELRLGFAIGFTGVDKRQDNDEVIEIDDDLFLVHADDVQAVSLIVPEAQISWRQTFGKEDRWFVEPGAAFCVVVGNYWVGQQWGWWVDEDESEWDATIGGRAFLRGGYTWDHFTLGLEASYMYGGNLGLTDQIDGDVREFYGGVFFGGRW